MKDLINFKMVEVFEQKSKIQCISTKMYRKDNVKSVAARLFFGFDEKTIIFNYVKLSPLKKYGNMVNSVGFIAFMAIDMVSKEVVIHKQDTDVYSPLNLKMIHSKNPNLKLIHSLDALKIDHRDCDYYMRYMYFYSQNGDTNYSFLDGCVNLVENVQMRNLIWMRIDFKR
eukprot:NODE_37_length_35953_cov_1.028037.p9 type:complete len:170 gc:universal NODE_37_length_35953_cov_1.028037:21299-20790(-)